MSADLESLGAYSETEVVDSTGAELVQDADANALDIASLNATSTPISFARDVEILKALPLFANMRRNKLAEFRAMMDECSFVDDSIIIDQSKQDKRFHVITSGSVEFVASDGRGGEMVIAEAGVGGFFGELNLLTEEASTIKVRAKGEVQTLALDKSEFDDFVERNPKAVTKMLSEIASRLAKTDLMLRESVSKDVNKLHADKMSFGERVADKFAQTIGSWKFILTQSALLATWVTLNCLQQIYHWDPYPFILLNLALSFQAAYAGPIIMMSQNRQSSKDRLAADVDHQVNVKSELSIAQALKNIERLEKKVDALSQMKKAA